MKKKFQIGVIGAGPAGLSTAYELQKHEEFDVVVFESSNQVGGRMSTRFKDGMAFDRGANFCVGQYQNTARYCKELGIESCWKPIWHPSLGEGEHYTVRDGELCIISLNSIWSILKFKALSLKSKVKLCWLFWNTYRRSRGLNFFDLASLPPERNDTNAYDYIKTNIGKDAADYIVDAFTSMYQFHSARQMSLGAMFALIEMMAKDTKGFLRYHTAGKEMSTIPEAMASRLNIKTDYPIQVVRGEKSRAVVASKQSMHYFDKVVIATTADVARKIYKNPSNPQTIFLDGVEYASTINVSFKIPTNLINNIACVAVPYVENRIISEYTNEFFKGIAQDGKTLVNVGLHEEAAQWLISKTDREIFDIVRAQFLKVCPPLRDKAHLIEAHDLERWPSAMPKFSQKFVARATEFWQNGQGNNNIYLAGDMTGCPWVEGAFTSGIKVAGMIREELLGPDVIFIK